MDKLSFEFLLGLVGGTILSSRFLCCFTEWVLISLDSPSVIRRGHGVLWIILGVIGEVTMGLGFLKG